MARAAARQRDAEKAAREEAVNGIPQILIDRVALWRRSPKKFIEQMLSVSPLEGGEIVPFILNPGQNRVIEVVERQLTENRPVRVIVLKSRRQGISTLGEALIYWATSMFPYRNGMVVAHKKQNTSEIFRIARLFWDTDIRQRLGPYNLRPEVLNSNEMAIRFDVDRRAKEKGHVGLHSSMLVETAEGTGVGVGMTLHACHFSEVGKWDNPRIMAGLGIALSKTPGSIGIVESTAEGSGNLFHKMWQDAKAGRSEYEPVFLPWSLDPRCVAPVSNAEIETWDFLDATERDLYERHHLTMEQLKWRRITLNSPDMIRPGVTPEDVFKQEYPITDTEAFLSSGQHFFLQAAIEDLSASGKGVKKPKYRAKFVLEGIPSDRKDVSPIIRPPVLDDYGELSVWEDPQPDEDYVIGADVAQGLEHRDRSVAWVLKRSTLKYVARLKTVKIDADQFGQKCCLLGWWYNSALLGPEINGPGVAAIAAVRRLRYARVWFDRDLVKPGEPVTQHIGFRTTSANRRSMLERLEEEIRRKTIDMPAEDFYDEARKFILVDTGSGTAKPQAMVDEHDDEIMSAAITLQLHLHGGAMRNRGTASSAVAASSIAAKAKARAELIHHPKAQPFTKKKANIRIEMF